MASCGGWTFAQGFGIGRHMPVPGCGTVVVEHGRGIAAAGADVTTARVSAAAEVGLGIAVEAGAGLGIAAAAAREWQCIVVVPGAGGTWALVYLLAEISQQTGVA